MSTTISPARQSPGTKYELTSEINSAFPFYYHSPLFMFTDTRKRSMSMDILIICLAANNSPRSIIHDSKHPATSIWYKGALRIHYINKFIISRRLTDNFINI
ncbi:hypothetical protein Rahaq_2133 [Rahnella aceris]|uniref:Uncharacterized protein n=1 Tax=Rahnella sp. (strain Y9602) TaxID=2703885 RepID=A0A0H3FA56_RAHSY|nr:hypothetical protein Rahaq_2133 [Rahnella aceris]